MGRTAVWITARKSWSIFTSREVSQRMTYQERRALLDTTPLAKLLWIALIAINALNILYTFLVVIRDIAAGREEGTLGLVALGLLPFLILNGLLYATVSWMTYRLMKGTLILLSAALLVLLVDPLIGNFFIPFTLEFSILRVFVDWSLLPAPPRDTLVLDSLAALQTLSYWYVLRQVSPRSKQDSRNNTPGASRADPARPTSGTT